ncbi:MULTISPECIES: 2-amino-4-hydroxy-6-hydroxymethyldihydropteridine diphosphokinase [unclassified Ensifer]|uniref:2-amino-4-hydroxy-6- hydroxymethyldihydropteridine diphosphokinase n=1 Tax=unclassified Ensifer TaxID=2633371 RepID=UPI0008132AE3|nr:MULTISPECIES: 2-amino-4-hydroxy-6-hydroxymethyldihydropteridine diphosphokinase [unclassified Ensifer]OCP03454.1 2-amino-4-hydroxy-6-hydroxymethyldihydropteridine diphosphokinase [Ensifer sp. LC11]OCP03747.1 2-amino-4-hydroxy-6-hydroxymethyldihydropteridine diphosphokinase [Ensifer sp. LC13]OCP08445.1 2-amino-4-hydroxy-6-hydroxymethyldihydropteridine diphosphokinase [Ensifer sp. LC14]OCP30216.1 2-amino-4-hydroxy-6-hydroxymethyldihydropteridine diphosphokinase [Ensifer sp. LC499]
MSSERIWRSATLGLGGNLGDPPRAMAEALAALDARADCAVRAVSRLYRTPPWGKTDQAWFFNACAEVETTLAPEALLDACLDIERSMKRVRDERWGPRTLDIDVLTFAGVVQVGGRLELPHPRMTERGFVLMPLADFAADMPVHGRPVGDWLQQADITGIEVADGDRNWWRSQG